MASPVNLCFAYECRDSRKASSAQYLIVWNFVRPTDFEQVTEAAKVTVIKLMSPVSCPCLTCRQEGCQEHSLVDFEL